MWPGTECTTKASGIPSASAIEIPPLIPAHVNTAIVPPHDDDDDTANTERLRVPEQFGGANHEEEDRIKSIVGQLPDFLEHIPVVSVHGELDAVISDKQAGENGREGD